MDFNGASSVAGCDEQIIRHSHIDPFTYGYFFQESEPIIGRS